MKYLFNLLLYRPLFNLLIFLYNIIPGHDMGIAIIALTVIIKFVLHPFSKKSIEAQKQMQTIQPKLNELKEKYKDDKEKLTKEMLKLYKEEKVNPVSSCLPLLLQFPFLIAVFLVFKDGLTSDSLGLLYSFVKNPVTINTLSLGFLNLASPNPYLAVLAAGAQYWQTKMMMEQQPPQNIRNKEGAKDENMMAIMSKQMMYVMPLFTLIIGLTLPGGLTLYFLVFSLLMGLQQKKLLQQDAAKNQITPEQNKE